MIILTMVEVFPVPGGPSTSVMRLMIAWSAHIPETRMNNSEN
jgi:hypothetical protein